MTDRQFGPFDCICGPPDIRFKVHGEDHYQTCPWHPAYAGTPAYVQRAIDLALADFAERLASGFETQAMGRIQEVRVAMNLAAQAVREAVKR